MSANVIEVEGLKKVYRRARRADTIAVDDLSLAVPEGGVFGFLGPNGSGKTTTIRCLLGLIAPSKGSVRLLGADVLSGGLPTVLDRVGSIVETPGPFPGFSARRNLRLLGRTAGIGPIAVDAALDRVGLGSRADDLLKTYSLGMKQRWALAAALLKDPALLILDEPANGLDPAGIKEIRELIRSLADEGRTVFISSHILTEVQQVCDHVAILSRGKAVAQGSVDDVLTGGGASRMLVKAADLAKAEQILSAAGFVLTLIGDELRVDVAPSEAATVTKALASKRVYVTELRPDEVSLEDVFLSLTQEPPA